MIQVWRCDYCTWSNADPDVILKHELGCSFNRATKKCHTCEFSYEEGYNWEHIPGCELRLDANKYEEEGNCPKWVYYNLVEDRQDKLIKLGL